MRDSRWVLIAAGAGAGALPILALAGAGEGALAAVRGATLASLCGFLLLMRRDSRVPKTVVCAIGIGAGLMALACISGSVEAIALHPGALLVAAGAVLAFETRAPDSRPAAPRPLSATVDALPHSVVACSDPNPLVASSRSSTEVTSAEAPERAEALEPAVVRPSSAGPSAGGSEAEPLDGDDTRERDTELRRIDFLINVSHELRTPLTSILGFSRLFQDGDLGPLTADQSECIGRVVTQGLYLVDLLNNLLDLSRLEAGRVKLERAPFDFHTVVKEVTSNLASLSKDRGVDVRVAAPADLPAADGDRQKIVQVLINLISNAIKFSAQGGRIEVSARAEGDEILVCVSDTGIGIPKEEQECLFEKFYQGRAGRAGATKGTGLGLAIVREIVRLHGGHIWVESELGQGSRFYFTLATAPLATASPEPERESEPSSSSAAEASPEGRPAHTILVVDDRPEIVLVLQMKLGKVYQVITARNGEEAIARAQDFQPDLILMDIMMPVLDGIEATRRLKEDLRTTHIPVYALTAKPARKDRDRMVAAGFSGIFSKPFDPQALLEALDRILDGQPADPPRVVA